MVPLSRSAPAEDEAARTDVVVRVVLNDFGLFTKRPFQVREVYPSLEQAFEEVLSNEIRAGTRGFANIVKHRLRLQVAKDAGLPWLRRKRCHGGKKDSGASRHRERRRGGDSRTFVGRR